MDTAGVAAQLRARQGKLKRWRVILDVLASVALMGAMLFGTAGTAGAASIIYVKANASGLNNGTSWKNAYKSLQTALAHAPAGSGDQIWVAMGTYKPTAGTDRTVSFRLKNGVAIYGGFAGTETLLSQRNPPLNVTVLSGDIGVLNNSSDNSYHVVMGNGTNNTAVLDGFTITLGNASAKSTTSGTGGGMYNFKSNSTLRNLVFSVNSAVDFGGGMVNDTSNPTLTNVTFSVDGAFTGGGMWNFESAPKLTKVTFAGDSATDGAGMANVAGGNPVLNQVLFASNSASGNGGGMYNSGGAPSITATRFNGNEAVNGAGIYNDTTSPTLTNVAFNINAAGSNGGGMFNVGASPTVTNASFAGNTASFGGGMYNLNGSSPTVRNTTFSGNSANNGGGGIYNDGGSNPTVANVTLSGNSASAGGGIFNEINSSPTLTNVTFNGNSATSVGGMVDDSNSNPLVQDSIFWGDGTPEISDTSSAPVLHDSTIQTGCSNGGSCLNIGTSDPKLGPLQNNGGFAKTTALTAGSAAIDAGNNATCATKDERGVSRPQGGACDQGAYEVRAATFVSQAANDGQVLESPTVNGVGSSADSTSGVFHVGDNSSDRLWRGFLSFDTSKLPDGATIVMANVRVRQSVPAVGNPFITLGPMVADLATPYFGSSIALASTDWQASAAAPSAGTWLSDASSYWTPLSNAGMAHISKVSTTQVRLRFTFRDTNKLGDYVTLYSGEALTASNRPTMTVYYNP